MIFDAVESVAQKDGEGNTLIGRQALRDALYATSGMEGITGNISCNALGDCADPKIAVNQITGGAYVPIGGAMADDGGEAMAAPTCDSLTPVSLQLQWVTQSQFAGYFAARDQGFYEEFCLDVTILEGAVDIVPQQVVASGQAEFGIAWVPKVLASRAEGADLVNIAQVFQRSGTLEVSWADSPVNSISDMAGKRVGTWGFGNEHELFVALRAEGLDPRQSR